MISFRDLEYLEAVARLKSFSAAAEEVFVSQQALSASIMKIEQYIGEPLFIRTVRGVELTATGEDAYRIAADIVKELRTINKFATTRKDELRIVYPSRMVFHEILFYRTKQLFQQRYPNVSLLIEPLSSNDGREIASASFFSFSAHFRKNFNKRYMRYLKNYKVIPFHTDAFFLITGKDMELPVPGRSVAFTELYLLNDIDAKAEYLKQLENSGFLFKGEVSDLSSMEEILHVITTQERGMAIVPRIALERYRYMFDYIQIMKLPQFYITQHMIAYNKYQAQDQPWLLDFLDIFLEQSRQAGLMPELEETV